MNAPGWLTALVSTLMIFVAGYSLWRLAISRAWGRATDYESDILHLAVGIAAAGLVASWARSLPRSLWTGVFIAGAVYFAVRTYLTWSDRAVRGELLAQTGCCAVLVYMFLAGVAPTTIQGSTAGQYTMAGMGDGMILDQTITYPAIGLIFVVALCFYAVAVLNGIAPLRTEGGESTSTLMLAPRSVDVCRIVIVLVLAYAILTKLV
ncbi:DUF5134 domain-containing protein [Actinospica sp.]|uniref:DUF5134 domain-containing protein n=1 Tax=Actinospica sp. TaxID=1872142 RepID=UPI002CF17A2B|nr:DUF5134 domain-containing protein [Actinospica sp.]HWG24871.1 DUF5134 domain-containing protein [Actinospica sp.]